LTYILIVSDLVATIGLQLLTKQHPMAHWF